MFNSVDTEELENNRNVFVLLNPQSDEEDYSEFQHHQEEQETTQSNSYHINNNNNRSISKNIKIKDVVIAIKNF